MTALFGRRTERHRIDRLLADDGRVPSLLVLLGDVGAGKTTLLRYGVEAATDRGRRVLETPGVRGLLGRLDEPDPLRLRLAALTQVDAMSRETPLLVAVDDVSAADAELASVLMFLARRLPRARFALLFTAADLAAFPQLAGDVSLCRLAPLRTADAIAFLDSLPVPPVGRLRDEILRRADGNPLALAELSASPSDRLRVTARAVTAFAGPAYRLPEATRRVLLQAAAAEGAGLGTILASADAGPGDCTPAEEAGLIAIVGGELAFRHPMVSTALYYDAPEDVRRAAHARIAAVLPPGSGAWCWHTANAAPRVPDETVATLFERATALTEPLTRPFSAAEALAHAAEVSTTTADAARRYALAATEAARVGEMAWCQELWEQVLERTDDADLLATTATGIGYHLITNPAAGTLALVTRLLETGLHDRVLALGLLSVAASGLMVDGDPAGLPHLRHALGLATRMSPSGETIGMWPAESADGLLSWALAVADPAGWAAEFGSLRNSPLLRPLSGAAEVSRLLCVGGTAWLLDEPHIALDHLRRARAVLHASGAVGTAPGAFVTLAMALLEAGLWTEAEEVLVEAGEQLTGSGSQMLREAVAALLTTQYTRSGRLDRARETLPRLERSFSSPSRMARVLSRRAAGQLAAADGDHDRATDHFLAAFEPDGAPVHVVYSPGVIDELAASAAACGRSARVLPILAAEAGHSPRRRWVLRHASALVSPGADPADALGTLLTDPVAQHYPYDYAVASVHHADALRAQRRFVDARPALVSALDTFVRLGADRAADDVRAKLRASGVRSGRPSTEAFDALTAQQQHITRLAAQGLSNREIGAKYNLSPRTIGSHLYRIYPKLGVVRRDQLRDVVPQE